MDNVVDDSTHVHVMSQISTQLEVEVVKDTSNVLESKNIDGKAWKVLK